MIVDRLKTYGYQLPLSELTFAMVADRVYFQHPDGSWEGEVVPGQAVIHQVLDLELLRNRIRAARQRDPDLAGKIERRRGTMGYKPVFAGTRIPVETVRRYLAAGHDTAEIIESYPALLPADIDAARELATA